MRKKLGVLDFGASEVRLFIGEKKSDGEFRILGAGEAQTRGVSRGEIVHLGDAAEAVLEAARKAERSAGTPISTLYFNFDDPAMESVRGTGAIALKGEGEIGPRDVESACDTARRLVAHFEKQAVYACELGFVIDEKDPVANPVGVYGSKLEVRMHLIQARSACLEAWKGLMRRAHFEGAVAVLSAWSTAYGILPKADRGRKTLAVDLGSDFLNSFVFANHRIVAYHTALTPPVLSEAPRSLAAQIRSWKGDYPELDRVLVAGDLAVQKEWADALGDESPLPVQVAGPWAVPKLGSPRFASIAGLLEVAAELEWQSAGLHRNHGMRSEEAHV